MGEGRAGRGRGGDGGADPGHLAFRQFLEFAPDGHLVTDSQGVVLQANRAAAALLRCPKEFLPGKPLGLFVAVGYRNRFYECLSRLHGGASSDEFETRVGRLGTPLDVALRASAIDDDGGDGDGDGESAFHWLLRDVSERRRAEAARDDLMRRLVTAQEDERRRVARELHDSVAQLLTALLLGIHAVRDAGPLPPAALARLDDVQRIADELGRTAHDLAVRLRPTALDDMGLGVALAQHLEEWSARSGVEAHFATVGLDACRLPPEAETTLYRVVLEALTNVARHARARVVSVILERQDGHAVAVIEDDGAGFDPDGPAASGRLGLLGMRERVALVGGTLEVESGPGAGTTVVARIPLDEAEG